MAHFLHNSKKLNAVFKECIKDFHTGEKAIHLFIVVVVVHTPT